jgi:hypothetical protein
VGDVHDQGENKCSPTIIGLTIDELEEVESQLRYLALLNEEENSGRLF